jgi:hypothetical protein
MEFLKGIAEVFAALSPFAVAFLGYYQYTRNKMTDLKIEQYKKDEEAKSKRRNDNSAIVYDELWNLLHDLNADRVYIVQPHPLGNESMLSIYFEVKRKGIEGMRTHVQDLRISEVAKFSSAMARNLFMYVSDIEKQVQDRYAQALLSSYGTESAIIKGLSDNTHDWVGSIFCEFTRPMTVSEEDARDILHTAATNIQYILPEFK